VNTVTNNTAVFLIAVSRESQHHSPHQQQQRQAAQTIGEYKVTQCFESPR